MQNFIFGSRIIPKPKKDSLGILPTWQPGPSGSQHCYQLSQTGTVQWERWWGRWWEVQWSAWRGRWGRRNQQTPGRVSPPWWTLAAEDRQKSDECQHVTLLLLQPEISAHFTSVWTAVHAAVVLFWTAGVWVFKLRNHFSCLPCGFNCFWWDWGSDEEDVSFIISVEWIVI